MCTPIPRNPGGAFPTSLNALKQCTKVVCPLNSRGLLRLSGTDVTKVLQGLTTNNVNLLRPGKAMYSAFLNSKGRYLHDVFFSWQADQSLYVDVHKEKKEKLTKWLTRYKLRSDLDITDISEEFRVWAVLAPPNEAVGGVPDPRLPQLGNRVYMKETQIPNVANDFFPVGEDFYTSLRYAYGIPETKELEYDKSIILEYNFPWFNGISFSKGCYIGQELMARTHFKGTIRKRIFPVCLTRDASQADVSLPTFSSSPSSLFPPDLPIQDVALRLGEPVGIVTDSGKKAGQLYACEMGLGLAMLRLEHLEKAQSLKLDCAEVYVQPHKPEWWQ